MDLHGVAGSMIIDPHHLLQTFSGSVWAWAGLGMGFLIFLFFLLRPPSDVYARELYIGIDRPISVHGKVDKISRVGKSLRVEEYKTRKSPVVYEGDVWQLSFYKFILKRTQSKPVLEEGVVTMRCGDREYEKRVKLKTDEQVVRFFNRYQEVVCGVGAKKAASEKYCARCSHFKVRCQGPLPK